MPEIWESFLREKMRADFDESARQLVDDRQVRERDTAVQQSQIHGASRDMREWQEGNR